MADTHDMILILPGGCGTTIGQSGGGLEVERTKILKRSLQIQKQVKDA